ncbi:hypothetical protein MUP01_12370 [Candidatus Bathyarchaeota archaeon]|nr:hypothetical protein [Candidatus Bathyarchaeota archaeon]
MSEISGNVWWQVLGSMLTVLAIVVSIILYLKNRNRKRLSYGATSVAVLPSVETPIRSKLKIFFEDKIVKQIYLNTVTIANSGNQPIKREDYERPLSLNLEKQTQLLSVKLSKKTPESLQPSFSVENEKVIINPVLLNSGDQIVLTILTDRDVSNSLKVDARIVGVKEVTRFTGNRRPYLFLAASVVMILIEFLCVFLFESWFDLATLRVPIILAAIIALVLLGLSFYEMVHERW